MRTIVEERSSHPMEAGFHLDGQFLRSRRHGIVVDLTLPIANARTRQSIDRAAAATIANTSALAT